MARTVEDEVDKAFQTTFRLIFGKCNLSLKDLEDYLWLYHYKPDSRPSSCSGKQVIMTDSRYCKGAPIISQDEIDLKKAFTLDINKIKDLDSILEAISDRAEYAGNKVFGTSEFFKNVDNCDSSFFAYNCHEIESSKYAAYSSYIRAGSEYSFGSAYFLRSKYLIKCVGADNLTRAFESHFCINSADMFSCYYCAGCSNTMFSFNLRGKRYAIGNLELQKDKYLRLREKLVEESRQYIEKHKRFPSPFDFPPPKPEVLSQIRIPKQKPALFDLSKLEDAFRSTTRLVLGRELSPMSKYHMFLSERVNKISPIKTVLGGETFNVDFFFHRFIPKERALNEAEAAEAAKLHFSFEDGEEVSLKSVLNKCASIAFYQVDMREGRSQNNIESPIVYHATNTYKVCDATFAKNCAYCTFALGLEGKQAENLFGCHRALYSKFCIRCHNSSALTSCLEMDSCATCSNSMFCHNCENLDYAMFCFNAKSKRYAIGNVEVGRENYMRIRQLVLDEIGEKIERHGRLPFDIFTLACAKKSRISCPIHTQLR